MLSLTSSDTVGRRPFALFAVGHFGICGFGLGGGAFVLGLLFSFAFGIALSPSGGGSGGALAEGFGLGHVGGLVFALA